MILLAPVLLLISTEAHVAINRFGKVKCEYTPDVTKYEAECFFLGSVTEVPFFRIVTHSADWSKENDPKLTLLADQTCCYHMHMHTSWNMADEALSSVAAVFQDSRGIVYGTEMIVNLLQMRKMFTPKPIAGSLDFQIGCYCWAMGQRTWASESTTYVTYARSAQTIEIEVALIAESARRFLVNAPVNGLHLTWSRNQQTRQILESLNYELIKCGDGESRANPCHWGRLSMEESKALQQCLFGLRKQ